MEQAIFSRWFAKRLACLAIAAVLFGCLLSVVLARAAPAPGDGPDWAAPGAMTIRRVTGMTSSQSEPVLFSNLDCMPLTYRLAATGSMQSGCFTEAAFGLMDTDSEVVIFNGTDEGLPLVPFIMPQILLPWHRARDLIQLNPVNDGGSQISLYRDPFTALQDQRNLLTQVTAKRLNRPPDVILEDASGRPLVINPQTIAFSENGAWLVAETLGRSFVRVNLATLDITAFAPANGATGSAALLKSRVSITDDGRFAAIANDAAGAFKVYDLAGCNGTVNDLQSRNCRSYDYLPFAGQRIAGLQSVRHVRFVNDGLLSFEAITADPDNTGIYELAPTASITSLTDYIGLGDSYTSGEGAFDYLDGTDTPDNMCHLSRHSYPLLLTHDLFTAAGGHSVACSGATIKDIGSGDGSYQGQMRGVADLERLQQSQPLLLESVETNFLPGYVAQHRFVQRWQPRIATVSIGGNDVGFGNLVENCVEPHVSRHASDSTCYNTYEARLELSRVADRTVPRWTALYKQLRRESPDMRLYAIGYPQLVADTGTCGLNVQLNKSELEFAESMLDYLNQDIKKAAAAAGVPYVDISKALAGHRLCEAASYDVAVNGLTAGTDAGPLGVGIFGKESYHPNAFGQQLIEEAILRQTHNFTGVSPDDTPDAAPALLDAPRSGRPVNTLVPDDGLTSGAGKRGGQLAVRADGASDGLRPDTSYAIRLDGPDGSVLGTIRSDESGNLHGSVTIPDDIVPGGHSIDVTGENQSGEPVDVTQPIYIPASDADSDGDGIDDILDPCPGAINSGQDSDLDGIDDICDPLIGPVPPNDPGIPLFGGTETIVARFGPAASRSAATIASMTTAGGRQASVLGTEKARASPASRQSLRPSDIHSRPRCQLLWLVIIILLALLWLAKRCIQKFRFRLQ